MKQKAGGTAKQKALEPRELVVDAFVRTPIENLGGRELLAQTEQPRTT